MCKDNKKQLIERVMNRPLGTVRYKLVKRLFSMSEAEATILLGLIEKEEKPVEAQNEAE